MGCGCGRTRTNKTSRVNRVKKQITKKRKAKIANLNLTSTAAVVTPLTSKSSTCLSCVESKQSPEERKKGIRVCHKSNRLINNILRDTRYTCPLGKWKNTK